MKHINITDYAEELFDICSLYQVNDQFPGTMTPNNWIRYRTDDTPRIDYYNPCVIPKYGYNYSYAKTLLFRIMDWEAFCDFFNCELITNLGIYYKDAKYSWPCEHGIEVLVTHLSGIPYKQATGIIGVSGDPIDSNYNTWHLSDFDSDHPYIFDNNIYSGEFWSKSFLTQLQISSCAMQGVKPKVEIELTADVE
jgi:hypothetical protein